MSRQGGVLQTPPLFLTQGQYKQLERSFTDPLQRRITALEADVEYWQGSASAFDQQAKELRAQVTQLTDDKQQLTTANQQLSLQNTQLQTRVTELQNQILQDGTWPNNTTAITTNQYGINTDSIFIFTWPNGYGGNGTIAQYTLFGETQYRNIGVEAGRHSAVLIFKARENSLWIRDNTGDEDIIADDVTSVNILYSSMYNSQILRIY